MEKLKNKITILMVALTLTLVGCHNRPYYVDSCRVNEQGWNFADPCCFDVEITDTMVPYQFFVDLRTSTEFSYSNMLLYVHTTFPDGSISVDTLSLPVTAPDGRWYGRRSGRYYDNRYHFRDAQPVVCFPQAGNYRFVVTHAMRDTLLVGIRDVGIRLDPIEK